MANTGHKGIDVLETATRLVFTAALKDQYGARVTSGTTNIYIYELQSDGTLNSYDWNDNTFKSTALTTEVVTATHQTGNNSTTNTGVWTKVLSTLTGFTAKAIYIVAFNNATAQPPFQERKFQFGGAEGDVVITSNKPEVDVKAINGQTGGVAGFDRAARAITTGTVGSSSTITSIVTSSLSPSATATDQFKGLILAFDSTTTTTNLRGQKTNITTSSVTGVLTVSALSDAPVSGDTFVIE